MAHKYQTFANLLYASYSGLLTLGFAFAKGKKIGGRVVLVALMSCFVLTGLTGFTRLSAIPKSCESCKSCLKNLALLSLKDYRVLCKVCLEVAFAKKKRKATAGSANGDEKRLAMKMKPQDSYAAFVNDVRGIIDRGMCIAATNVNQVAAMTYWRVGRRIVEVMRH